jgi:Domain of Unknown Function with PDB structure (DUF3857)
VGSLLQFLSKFSVACTLLCAATLAQEPSAKPPEAAPPSDKTTGAKSEEKQALPFQIQLLETHIRFEANGDSRKEVHTIVKINDPAGARQFSRLGFDYNRAFQQVDIPLVKISHANGGTSEILPSAIMDAPNPAVQDFPAYHDVRVKSVRILGLQDGDTIEYRVITTTTKHPLAPDFWLEHTFDRSGQVVKEVYAVELPATRVKKIAAPRPATAEVLPEITSPLNPGYDTDHLYMRFSKDLPQAEIASTGGKDSAFTSFTWTVSDLASAKDRKGQGDDSSLYADLEISTYTEWSVFSARIFDIWVEAPSQEVDRQAKELTAGVVNRTEAQRRLFDFVATKIQTVDVALGATLFAIRPAEDTLRSKYGSPLDKMILLAALAHAAQLEISPAIVPHEPWKWMNGEYVYKSPSRFDHIVACDCAARPSRFLDPGLEVAPFGMVAAELRGRLVLLPQPLSAPPKITTIRSMVYVEKDWRTIPNELPFAALQNVQIAGEISTDGKLTAKVKYIMRGDNELLLREAFHQTPKERWKEVAGLLAMSDGFRGTITNVTASDPMATKDPFTVEYELTQAKFVDWSKKPVRIPALLPQIALPDLPGKTAGKIELGTPLDVQTSLKLQVPEGTAVQTPAATSVERDYATFASKYDGHLNTVTASRHIHFVMREIPAERAADYNAFLRAVQNDQAQVITLLVETNQGNRK